MDTTNENIMPWHKVYELLVELLKGFQEQNIDNSSKKLFELISTKTKDEALKKALLNLGNSNKDSPDETLTPLQLFGSFNDISLSEQERNIRLRDICNLLTETLVAYNSGVYSKSIILNQQLQNSKIDYNSWEGYHTNDMLAVLTVKEQNEVWEVLNCYNSKVKLAQYYKRKVTKWRNLDLYSFSVFLYWIDSNSFYPLTTPVTNILFQSEAGKQIIQSFISYRKYCQFDSGNLDFCRNLVLLAKGKQPDRDSTLLKLIDKENKNIDTNLSFKILGLSIFDKDKNKEGRYYKALRPNLLYKFYDCYDFSDNNEEITYRPDKDFDLYSDKGGIKISISAILGKNGSGKSTLFELIMMAIYSLSYQFDKIKPELDIVTGDTVPYHFIKQLEKINANLKDDNTSDIQSVIKGLKVHRHESSNIKELDFLNVDLFVKTTSIFRIKIRNGIVTVFRYIKEDKNKYEKPVKIEIGEDFLTNFCYTIAINYSIYGLNRLDMGDWIFPLFHKNDSYQIPIVIEPYRRDGNMDINTQTFLVKSRMLANILEPETSDKPSLYNSFRRITEEIDVNGKTNYKHVSRLKLVYNEDKIDNNIELAGESISPENLDKDFGYVINTLIPEKDNYKVDSSVKDYILNKLYKIAIRYADYNKHINKRNSRLRDVRGYIHEIYKDPSHVVFKIKQALNYLKYDLQDIYKNGEFNINDISTKIEEIKKNNKSDNLRTIDLIPPSFFTVDIILTNQDDKDIIFNTLSSGEKQLSYSINSILYHLKNIESNVSNERANRFKYNFVNILLDEVELYFHPELQRKYISHLIAGIKRAKLNKIAAINICCITHSPYMLSDIPESNILFLDNDGEIIKKKPKTFGANIHDLLIDGFFMGNSKGSFAMDKIQEIVKFHNKILRDGIEKHRAEYEDVRDQFSCIKEAIGEGYIRGIINHHLIEIDKLYLNDDYTNLEILKLESKLKTLNNRLKK